MTIAQIHRAEESVHGDSPVRLYCKKEGDSGKTPIFMVHGDKANSLLPKYLPDNIPFYAFHHMRFDGKKMGYLNVEQIAKMYVEELKTIQQEGPYFLSGFSLGGMIAFEMAHQLRSKGDEVKVMVFIDSKSHTLEGPKKYHNQQFKWTESRITKLPRKAYKKAIVTICTSLGIPIPKSQRPFYLMEQYRRGRREYHPDIYPGGVTLIRSTIDNFPDRNLGWTDFFKGEIKIIDIETFHHSLTMEPVIADIAAVFEEIYNGL